MASPQVEKGYIRIANDLWNEILRRDFSKRQMNLILFIWRLSYGTGQKDCVIERFNQFELTGVYKNDIKKELKFLRECSVLNWDEKTMLFSINKNYKIWQITPNKNWDSDKFDSLIHLNLSRKKVSEIPTKNKRSVSKTLTFNSEKVSKTLTHKLVKYQLRHPLRAVISMDSSSLKTLLKTSFKDINKKEEESASRFYQENGFGHLGGYAADMLLDWMKEMPEEVIILAMKEAVKRDARNWKYLNKVLNDWKARGFRTKESVEAAIKQFEKRSNTVPFKHKKASGEIDWANI